MYEGVPSDNLSKVDTELYMEFISKGYPHKIAPELVDAMQLGASHLTFIHETNTVLRCFDLDDDELPIDESDLEVEDYEM